MCEIKVGTSGYDYLEWIGPFYPKDLEHDGFLPFYARNFSTVELNYSYYRMPTATQLSRLAEKAGPGLVFSVKAHESLTHSVDPAAWKAAAGEFRAAVRPLEAAKRLGAVLLQFPYSFHYEPNNRRYLDSLVKELSELPLVIEFRNQAWYNNRVIDSFRSRSVALASMDMPALKGLPPLMDLVTSPLAYVRFHGRNGETWWGSDAASRYDYLYSPEELAAWVERVKGMTSKADRVLIYFNNHQRGQAVENARTFKGLLDAAGLLQ
jgi:uncharacterized protein YecE (DUF72 family)